MKWRYAGVRVLHALPVLVLVTFVVFMILLALPGDPTLALLGDQASNEERQVLREKMGLDRPLPVQYLNWAWNTASGEFGRSLRTQEPVSQMLAQRVPVTLQLTLMSIAFALIVGVPLGILAAARRNSWIDFVASSAALTGMAMPYFWVAILLIMFFSLRLGWFPPSGYVPFFEDPLGNLKLMVLPTLTVGSAMTALVMRQTRASVVQSLSQDFTRTAYAKGASELRVLWRHALPNALVPIVTVVGLQAGALVSGAVVTETVFALPGLGRMVVEGIFERDIAPVQAGILVIVFGVLLINLVTDLVYAVLDKRIKL